MADTHIVVTGPQGEVASGIVRRLREVDLKVQALQRGDDIIAPIRAADAVVILDGTLPGTDYHLALQAVGEAVAPVENMRLVSVTVVPLQEKERESFLARAEESERELARCGHPLTVIRCGFLVGGPDQPAPADRELFGEGRNVTFPGDGDQSLRPLLLDDLAKSSRRRLPVRPTRRP